MASIMLHRYGAGRISSLRRQAFGKGSRSRWRLPFAEYEATRSGPVADGLVSPDGMHAIDRWLVSDLQNKV